MQKIYDPVRNFMAMALAAGFLVGPSGRLQGQSQSPTVSQTVPFGGKNVPVMQVGASGPVIDGPALGGAPPNDLCQDAVVVALPAGGVVFRSGDNTGATDQFGFGNSVYEAITTTECLDLTIEYCGTDPAFTGAFTFLLVGCPPTSLVFTGEQNITDQLCGDGNLTLSFPQLPAGTYYYGVLEGAGFSGPYELAFRGEACTATPPAHDICDGAIMVTPSPDCVPVTGDADGTIVGSSLPALSCPGSMGDAMDDIWFSFVATAEEHTVIATPSEVYDAVIDVRSGGCGATTSIACIDTAGTGEADALDLTGLTIGETYYVRVYDWYNGLPGTTTVDLCVIGPAPEVCEADAGTLTADASEVCFEDDLATISATAGGDAVIPSGYELLYVLTEGAELVIINAGTLPEFVVDATGLYTTHTLVYDPATLDLSVIEPGVTTGFDVNALLIQGGGDICASLDVTGAPVDVIDCTELCDADAGSLTADASEVCFEDDMATISATAGGDAVIPSGYELLYVLTEGTELVIINAGTLPEFVVDATGLYTIHTLVYDPATLDLSVIEPGVTTGFDVNALLIQGGGDICASLDVTGAPVDVILCCDADAGTLTADASEVCFEDDMATISATAGGDAVVPSGFELLYVLTEGAELVIINAGTLSEFVVDATGLYTIHTLVYDPATLDLSVIEPGVTTGFDVNALLIQGGGDICASLDVTGAPVDVILCCDADAGTLTALASEVCLVGSTAMVSATANGDAVVPPGFEVVYVLTEGAGMVIQDVDIVPDFIVGALGDYIIHTLVYDPNTLDLSIVEIGITTAAEVNGLLIQGGGTICASLDLVGAPVQVIDCTPANDDCANAQLLGINAVDACVPVLGDNTYASQDAGDPDCDATNSSYADVWYSFNSGANTSVTIDLNSGDMEDWAIVVQEGCGGAEVFCLTVPTDPIDLPVDPDTDYIVRVYSNLQFGVGGAFTICITGDVPTFICDGGSVTTNTGSVSQNICQDDEEDIVIFTTTSNGLENYTYVLTNDVDEVITVLIGNSLDFNSAALGTYRVYGISHNGALVGADPGTAIGDITSDGECVELSVDFVTVNVEICTGVQDVAITSWNLFPNPSDGDATIQYSGKDGSVMIEVVDMGGRLVFGERMAVSEGSLVQLRLAGQVAPGTYAVLLTSGLDRHTLRMVVR